jgi:DNA-binding NtrC family response regulator
VDAEVFLAALANRTVLVVDDEPSVCHALSRALATEGYKVLTAESGVEALRLLHDQPVQVIISDQRMPELSGIDLLKLVRVRYPRVVRIMLTGDKDPETTIRSINEGEVYRFIRKPWRNADLRAIVHFAFGARAESTSAADPVGLEKEIALLAEDELLGG